jgi:hypothetical protein
MIQDRDSWRHGRLTQMAVLGRMPELQDKPELNRATCLGRFQPYTEPPRAAGQVRFVVRVALQIAAAPRQARRLVRLQCIPSNRDSLWAAMTGTQPMRALRRIVQPSRRGGELELAQGYGKARRAITWIELHLTLAALTCLWPAKAQTQTSGSCSPMNDSGVTRRLGLCESVPQIMSRIVNPSKNRDRDHDRGPRLLVTRMADSDG